MSGLDGLIKLAAVTAAIREIEREATGAGILQPGAAYALGALAEACGVQPGDTADDLATALVSKRVPQYGRRRPGDLHEGRALGPALRPVGVAPVGSPEAEVVGGCAKCEGGFTLAA